MSSTPTTLGKYQIIREIARSNDIVYEAYDPLMNRRVALKELSMPKGSTPQQAEERIKRFEREVRAAGSLSHPGIVTIYEFGVDADRHYMAMEFLDGRTLRNELDTHGFLAPDRALEIALEVLSALAYAHDHGVIHRDIKPENIQILENGRIKLTDFGIARLTFEPNLTMDGQVFGTPSYMSPEQIVGKDIDARSDVFSMGVVLYEMIAGEKPFKGDSVVSISYAIMNAAPAQPSQATFGVWQIVSRAIDKSPALRFPTAKDMRLAVELERESIRQGSVVAPQMILAPPPLVAPPPSYYPQPTGYMNPQQPAPPVTGQPYYPQQAPSQIYPNAPYAGQNTHMGMPVYYPPPPRAPLLSPAAKVFLGRLVITFLVLGALFGLVVWGVAWISESIARDAARRAVREQSVPTRPAPQVAASSQTPAIPSTQPAPQPDREAVADATPTFDNDQALRLMGEAYALANPESGAPDFAAARMKLYEARNLAQPGSDVERRINAALESLTLR